MNYESEIAKHEDKKEKINIAINLIVWTKDKKKERKGRKENK